MQAGGIKVPEWVLARLAAGEDRFYKKDGPTRTVAAAALGRYADVAADSRVISLEGCGRRARRSERNASASLLDIGDGVFCVEFQAKMNAIDGDIVRW
jgi:3-hydroxyacyl-CoA dehydrogenase